MTGKRCNPLWSLTKLFVHITRTESPCVYSYFNVSPPLSLSVCLPPSWTAKSGACLYDNVVQAGSASWRQSLSQSSVGITARNLHTASRPGWEWKKRTRKSMYVAAFYQIYGMSARKNIFKYLTLAWHAEKKEKSMHSLSSWVTDCGSIHLLFPSVP